MPALAWALSAVRGVIVDLDRSMPRDPGLARPVFSRAAISSVLWLMGCVAFAVIVLIGRPTAVIAPSQASQGTDPAIAGAFVPRGAVLKPLQLPGTYANVDLAAMPDRLANEAAPWTLRGVVVIRGAPGVASVEGPAMISWTENGIAYSMASSTRSTIELIQIANDLR
jgi:hypothetical protein